MSDGKRFRLESGHIVIVDETDAHIMRTRVWRGRDIVRGHVVTSGDTRLGTKSFLSHYLAGEPGKEVVVHLNGNDLDFRRSNLKALTKAEFNRLTSAARRAAKL